VVSASGKVAAVSGNLTVQPLETSLVRRIDVKEGQVVRAGEALAELDPTFAQADEGSSATQVASLEAEVARLTAENAGRAYVSDGSEPSQLQALLYQQRHSEWTFRMANYDQKIASLKVKVAQASAAEATLTQRLALAATVEGKRAELERLGVGSQLNRMAAQDTRLDYASQLQQARSDKAGGERDLAAQIAERDSFEQQWASDVSQQLTEQGRKLTDAQQDLAKARLRRNLVVLRAERDAIVLRVAPVNVGTVMQSGQDLFELVPLDAPLQIDGVISGHDVGFVRAGDPVTIKFETFPYPLYGTARGHVVSVSPDSFKDPEAAPSQQLRVSTQDAMGSLFFRTRVAIDEMQLHDLPGGAQVLPGMPVTADVKIGKRTVLGYLASRFMPPLTEGMREP
jgi:HlyD family secretion protein